MRRDHLIPTPGAAASSSLPPISGIRTLNTYAWAAAGFAAWCEAQHIAPSLSFAFPLLLAKRRISEYLLILAAGEANENSRDHFPERR